MSKDIFPKWIITHEFELILGLVTFHKQLHPEWVPRLDTAADEALVRKLQPGVLGGGWFQVRPKEKTLHLFDSSTDFGKPTKEQILRAVTGGILRPRTLDPHPNLKSYKVLWSPGASALTESQYYATNGSPYCHIIRGH